MIIAVGRRCHRRPFIKRAWDYIYNGSVALDVDFGLGVDDFTFVGYDHFWDHNLRPYFVPHDHVVVFFHDGHIMNGYRMDHGRFVIEGLA